MFTVPLNWNSSDDLLGLKPIFLEYDQYVLFCCCLYFKMALVMLALSVCKQYCLDSVSNSVHACKISLKSWLWMHPMQPELLMARPLPPMVFPWLFLESRQFYCFICGYSTAMPCCFKLCPFQLSFLKKDSLT